MDKPKTDLCEKIFWISKKRWFIQDACFSFFFFSPFASKLLAIFEIWLTPVIFMWTVGKQKLPEYLGHSHPFFPYCLFSCRHQLLLYVRGVQTNINFGPSFRKITLKNDFWGSIRNFTYHSQLLLACLIDCMQKLVSYIPFFPFVFLCLFLCCAKRTSSPRLSVLVLASMERVENQL